MSDDFREKDDDDFREKDDDDVNDEDEGGDGYDEDEEDEEEYEEEDEEYVRGDFPRIEPERAKAYKKTLQQLKTFYREISLISNKKPNDPLNKFKLGLINESLEKANFVLGDKYRPFPNFSMFNEANMPSASDVVLMISHYLDGFHALHGKYCVSGHWRLTDDSEVGHEDDL